MIRKATPWLLTAALTSVLMVLLLSGCGTEQTEQAEADVPPDTTQETMADQLTAQREAFKANAPAEAKQVLTRALDSLRQSDILQSALNVGDTIPRFELPDAAGGSVDISDLLAEGPLVLVFYRGNW